MIHAHGEAPREVQVRAAGQVDRGGVQSAASGDVGSLVAVIQDVHSRLVDVQRARGVAVALAPSIHLQATVQLQNGACTGEIQSALGLNGSILDVSGDVHFIHQRGPGGGECDGGDLREETAVVPIRTDPGIVPGAGNKMIVDVAKLPPSGGGFPVQRVGEGAAERAEFRGVHGSNGEQSDNETE